MTFTVVYDANVLYPNTLRDLLIRIALATFVPAVRAARSSTVDAINDAARQPRRRGPAIGGRVSPGRRACVAGAGVRR
jgi:hypothetical protein